MIANVLSIAGTDPTGGAGIQADLKTFSALGVYGMSVITAVVAQNTCGVRSVLPLDPFFVADQIDAVFEDVRVDAVKIGMVATARIAEVICARLTHHKARVIVIDPVMVAQGGDKLLMPDAIEAIRNALVPMATLVTPNLPEAGVLLNRSAPSNLCEMRAAATELRALGSGWVLLKGGHLLGPDCLDVLDGPQGQVEFIAPRVATRSDHGTGCTLSAAVAAFLPRQSMEDSIENAKNYLHRALREGWRLDVGKGRGPVHHFHALWAANRNHTEKIGLGGEANRSAEAGEG